MKKVKKLFVTFFLFFACFASPGFAMEQKKKDYEKHRYDLYRQISDEEDPTSSSDQPLKAKEKRKETKSSGKKASSLFKKALLNLIFPEYFQKSNKETEYSFIAKLNNIFNQTNDNEIQNKNAEFENWMDGIPLDFRKCINKEILTATDKYLSENLNNKDEKIFNYLPDESLIKTALCFLHYLNLKNNETLKVAPLRLYTQNYYPSLQMTIKTFTIQDKLYEIFNAADYWGENKLGIFSFINIFPELENGITPKREILLQNSLYFIETLFNTQIQKLDLSCNGLSNIPHSVFLMDNLQELILHKNKIMVILEDIWHLQKLQILDLKNNNLQKIPEELLQLPNLKEVDLRGNPSLAYQFESLEIIQKLKDKGVKIRWS